MTADFENFLTVVRKYTGIPELAPTVLNEFIQWIEVHAAEKVNGRRIQAIDIYYNAVGVINVPADEELKMMIAERQEQTKQHHKSA